MDEKSVKKLLFADIQSINFYDIFQSGHKGL